VQLHTPTAAAIHSLAIHTAGFDNTRRRYQPCLRQAKRCLSEEQIMCAITDNTVFDRTEWVVVRPQKGNYLFYNSRTDELHLIPPTGHAVYELCDGLRTVAQINNQLSEGIDAEPSQFRDRLTEFLGALERRGLVERADA
jgi:hypothetical protein